MLPSTARATCSAGFVRFGMTRRPAALAATATAAHLTPPRRGLASRATADAADQQRVLDVAIVGLPNAGKSSLLNTLLARRVSAVSSKRNTTRQNLVGVASSEASGVQLIFYDTPGFLHVRDFQGKEEGSSREVR